MAFYQDMPWHEGEVTMHKSMHVPEQHNPSVPTLSPQLANHLQVAPLIAIGTLDQEGRPWTSLWGGEKGLARPIGDEVIGIRTPVPARYDPVVEELVGTEPGEIRKAQGKGQMVSGLTIDLETRKRTKLFGRMVAGALLQREDEVADSAETVVETQLVLKIEQSLGNCPKYLNVKRITAARSVPKVDGLQQTQSPQLSQRSMDLLAKADLFFISSSYKDRDMDTNHRGGPPGFARVVSNEDDGAVLVWPEYSGNRLYQTLGNLSVTPKAGICVPDFQTGDMLYITGDTEILVGQNAAKLLPRSNLAVKLKVTEARHISSILPFRGAEGAMSPYNPIVRYATTEKKPPQAQQQELQQATLLRQTRLTPTISRFTFSLTNPASYKAGQYVTLDLSEYLDIGYSHMRNDDPRSLNDDFVRTFTISSPPGDNPVRRLGDAEFNITIRKVGVVTEFLFKFDGKMLASNGRGELEVGVKGFGGEFEVQQAESERIGFIAAGVGITPLLPSLGMLDYSRLIVLWSVRAEDLPLVLDVLEQHPDLGPSLSVFVSKAADTDDRVQRTRTLGAKVQTRRLEGEDVKLEGISKVYLCTSLPMRKQLEQWFRGKELVFEDFSF